MIIVNGRVVGQGAQFSLRDVEVITATVDLEEVRSYRSSKSRAMQARDTIPYQRIEVDISLSSDSEDLDRTIAPSKEIKVRYHLPEYVKAFSDSSRYSKMLTKWVGRRLLLGPPHISGKASIEFALLFSSLYTRDYLRRSRQAGYFVALSGGIDSCATSVIIHSMCRLVHQEVLKNEDPQILEDLLRITGEEETSSWRPSSPQEIATRIFCTAYMGMAKNSSKDTKSRAKSLSQAIGSYHLDFYIDSVFDAMVAVFTAATHFTPRWRMYGGSNAENTSLQNIQARLRMVFSYLIAQLIPTVRGRCKPGSLLVIGSANVDESLRGYYTFVVLI